MGFALRQVNPLRQPTNLNLGGSQAVPAPFGGINLRDDITALQPNEARYLENWMTDSGSVKIRPGFAAHGSGVGSGNVATLATYHGASSSKLIAAGGGAIYDATSAGAASSLATGFSVNRWSTTTYNGRLFFVNGTDAPQDYNGSAVAATAWSGTGLTITNLRTVKVVRNRLWFTENNSADVWYGGIGSITGALTKFQLSQIANGGKCVGIDSWSRDAGDGQDDLTVFIMNTGQIIIYEGDPAGTFTLIGKYGGDHASRTVDIDSQFKLGGELVVITDGGFLPVSAATGGVNLSMTAVDPWGKIAPVVEGFAKLHASKGGWHGAINGGFLYVNVPTLADTFSTTIVMNIKTGAWTLFTGWNASSFASYNGDLYFGAMTGGFVRKVTGSDDVGANIVAQARGAFVIPSGDTSRTNLYTAARLKILGQGDISGTLGVDTDFFETSLVGASSSLLEDTDTTPWSSPWSSPWGSKPKPSTEWISVLGEGRSVAPKLTASTSAQDVTWYATDILWKPGGVK